MNARPKQGIAALKRFARVTPPRDMLQEHCELCNQALSAEHPHLVEPMAHVIRCACEPCALLFANRTDGRYRRVPRDARALDDFQMTDAEWDALAVPIGMAFFFYSTPDKRMIALYPGPAGATESLLSLDAWDVLAARNPVLAALEPDAEALLVNRIEDAREYFRAPIDRCYALVGLIRTQWRGISGGEQAWAAIDGFFAQLREGLNGPERLRHG